MKNLFCQIDKKKFNPKYFIVMGKRESSDDWSPMTFCDQNKCFCWANPSDEYHPDESVELYDRSTVMYLLGETIHSKDGKSGCDYRLLPAYTGFELIPKLFMIMEDGKDNGPFTPLCRGEYAPLTWANTGRSDLPAPELFDLQTAHRMVAIQKEWEVENDREPEDCLNMVIIPMQYNHTNPSPEDHLVQLSKHLLLT